jgi:hypothetical protein
VDSAVIILIILIIFIILIIRCGSGQCWRKRSLHSLYTILTTTIGAEVDSAGEGDHDDEANLPSQRH